MGGSRSHGFETQFDIVEVTESLNWAQITGLYVL